MSSLIKCYWGTITSYSSYLNSESSSMDVQEDVFNVTNRFSEVISKKNINYGDIVTCLRDIRSVLNIDSDQYGSSFIDAQMHSIIAVNWSILIESGEAVEEALKCLLLLCRNESIFPIIAEELLGRGIHNFCFHSIKKYLRRKNIKIYGIEMVSLLINTCFAKDSLIFLNSERSKKVSSVLQDMLVQGGLSTFSQLFVEFVKNDIHSRSIYRLLLCKSFCSTNLF